jgi:hypothetical protein
MIYRKTENPRWRRPTEEERLLRLEVAAARAGDGVEALRHWGERRRLREAKGVRCSETAGARTHSG